VDILAVASGAIGAAGGVARLAEEGGAGGLTINLFWVVVAALNFAVFLAIIWVFAFKPLSGMLESRRERIEQGLQDAEQARKDRSAAEAERLATLTEARREANDIINRAQKVAQETRDADIAATRVELERMRTQASAEIDAEKQRAIADLRADGGPAAADLALAAPGRVVGESMTDDRQRRLVEDFLRETASTSGTGH
jgi:F-type H+-transporting ATPase subunit b